VTDARAQAGSVAIIITTYNHEFFLESALHSAVLQTRQASEIIVVDDGSRDDPEAVTRKFPGVRLIRQPNAGLAAARNTGWRAATSEFVVFLDADDRLLPNALQVNLEQLAAEPEAGFSYGAYINVDTTTGRKRLAWFTCATGGFPAFLRRNAVGMHATVMYRRGSLAEIGGFEVSLPACEDYDVYLRMVSRFPVVCSPVPLAEYWHHGGNMSRDSAMMLRSALAVLARQQPAAERLGEAAAYREGVTGWKRNYVGVWCLALLQGLRTGSVTRSLLAQGISLARQAPLTVAGAPLWGARELLLLLHDRVRRGDLARR
jgi:glycosyltransferase involved in cell wall biosynthesis